MMSFGEKTLGRMNNIGLKMKNFGKDMIQKDSMTAEEIITIKKENGKKHTKRQNEIMKRQKRIGKNILEENILTIGTKILIGKNYWREKQLQRQ